MKIVERYAYGPNPPREVTPHDLVGMAMRSSNQCGQIEQLADQIDSLQGILARIIAFIPEEHWLPLCGLEHKYEISKDEAQSERTIQRRAR